VHAPHGKAHNKASSGGDDFADLLTQSAAPEEKEAPPRPAGETRQSQAAEKPTAGDKTAGKTEDAPVAAESSQAEAPQAEAAAEPDAGPAPDQNDTAANDNDAADILAALPQQPQQTQIVAAPAIATPAPAPAEKPAATAKTDTNTDIDAGMGAVTDNGLNPAALTAAPVQAAPAPAAPAQPQPQTAADVTIDTAKPVAPQAAPPGQDAKPGAEASDFQKALHQASDTSDTPQANIANSDAAKPADAAAPPAAAKPSPDIGTIALAPQTSHAVPAQGAEKPVMTAQAQTEARPAPQAMPNVNQMAVEVAARSQSGAKQFDIRLDPPELGRVEVRLSIDAHGKAEAHLTADQPQTLDLLQKDAPALARALRDAGLNVQQDALNFSLKNQQQQNFAGGGDHSRQGGRNAFNTARNQADAAVPDAGAYTRRSLGVLDIKV
jgi:flagellar hook-length control protein FliK